MEASLTLKSLSSFRNCSEEKFSLHSNLPLESQKILSVLIQNLQQKHQKVTMHGCKLVRFVGQEGQISAETTNRKTRDRVERKGCTRLPVLCRRMFPSAGFCSLNSVLIFDSGRKK